MYSVLKNAQQEVLAYKGMGLKYSQEHKEMIACIWFNIWLPVFQSEAMMPVEISTDFQKDRRLPKKAKEALQVSCFPLLKCISQGKTAEPKAIKRKEEAKQRKSSKCDQKEQKASQALNLLNTLRNRSTITAKPKREKMPKAEFIKCHDDHSGTSFQIKLLSFPDHQIFEFSCGCCFTIDEFINISPCLYRKEHAPGFLYFHQIRLAFIKCYNARFLKKNDSLWANDPVFEKTPHFCCKKDPWLIIRLVGIIKASRMERIGWIFGHIEEDLTCIARSKEKEATKKRIKNGSSILQSLSNMDKIWEACDEAEFVWYPIFNSTVQIPTQEREAKGKERKLPKELKNALQIQPVAEKPLSEKELVDLFNQSSEKLKKRKAKETKKPNKGKAPNAIRKTKKPTKL
ncbi:Oidioi.mRNA.OKI2018_I69.PAR.g13094.t1.cds [Oikopleura dioica]|uniref:Oidioi.mRNA.OKI2018_I69.PAR.g13094.t1.cds n=1 Tax=Oikopleura dioica TaxID=34765 RepID=A0ABN7S6M1_OIKDI|nr:Oidioi.mRNA.OKI2018_I69.PAR.g13094.t1.cds [Oikopleura dioica]